MKLVKHGRAFTWLWSWIAESESGVVVSTADEEEHNLEQRFRASVPDIHGDTTSSNQSVHLHLGDVQYVSLTYRHPQWNDCQVK